MSGNVRRDLAAEHALADLRHRFCDTLEIRLIEIDQAAQACHQTGADASFQLLRDYCHRLAGVGASFGFADLGDRARWIDMTITQCFATERSEGWKRRVLAEAENLMIAMEAVLPEQQERPPQTGNDTHYG